MKTFNVLMLITFVSIVVVNCGGKNSNSESKSSSESEASETQTVVDDTLVSELIRGVKSEDVKNDLTKVEAQILEKLLENIENRKNYIRGEYAGIELLKRVKEEKLEQDREIMAKVERAKNDIYFDALLKQHLKDKQSDYLVLARDEYEINQDKFKTQKRIRIAQIFVSKYNREEKKAREIIDKAKNELASGELSFSELADRYSEDKENSNKGGVYDKWLLAPLSTDRLSKVLLAAFSLKERDDVTKVIESRQGYHIIKLIAIVPSVVQKFDVVQESIIADLKNKYMETTKVLVKQTLYPPAGVEHNDAALKRLISKELSSRKTKEGK